MTHAPDRRLRDLADIEAIADALRADGQRFSAAARIVLEALFSADGPVAAADIASGFDGRTTPLELTSVYRNLERLQELGAVTHLHVGHGPGLYALGRGVVREYVVCEGCGRVTDVDPADLDAVRDRVRELTGYVPRFDHFPMHGFCATCAADRAASPGHEHGHDHAHRR